MNRRWTLRFTFIPLLVCHFPVKGPTLPAYWHFCSQGPLSPKCNAHTHTGLWFCFFRITTTLMVLNTNRWTRWGYCLCLCHQKHSSLPPPGCPCLSGWQHTLCHHLNYEWRSRHLKKMEAPVEHACEPALCRADMVVYSLCKENLRKWHQIEKVYKNYNL